MQLWRSVKFCDLKLYMEGLLLLVGEAAKFSTRRLLQPACICTFNDELHILLTSLGNYTLLPSKYMMNKLVSSPDIFMAILRIIQLIKKIIICQWLSSARGSVSLAVTKTIVSPDHLLPDNPGLWSSVRFACTVFSV